MTARMCRHNCETDWRDVICYEGDSEEIRELFDDEDEIRESFLNRYDLRYVPE